jgi:CheY-like chemotaxis protein
VALILVVDDARTECELMGKTVTGAGHEVIYAAHGKDAIALANQHKPALIFLDVVMPIMDGFATCRHLRRDPATAQIPIVLLTAKSKESDVFWGKRHGASEHIAKPWTSDVIIAIIDRYCR